MPRASDSRATLSDTLRRFWRGLRDYDPWKVRLVDRGRVAFSVTWSTGLSAMMWIGGALLIGAAVVCVQAWSFAWFLPVIGVLAVLGVVAAWRTPTFVADPEFDASLITPGAIYCGDRRENSRGEDVPSDMACVVIAVFRHHGAQAKPVWIALADGTRRTFALTATTRIIFPHDNFGRWRIPRSAPLEYLDAPSLDVLTLVEGVWDNSVSEPSRAGAITDALGWSQQRAERAVADGDRLNVIEVQERGGFSRTEKYLTLTNAGCIWLAQEARSLGIEIYAGAEQSKQEGNVTNYGNMNYNSPGSAINTGSGSANVNVSVTVDELTINNLTTLADSAETIARQVDETDAELIRDAAAEIRRALAQPEPDGSVLKGAARTVLRAGGSVGLGVVGNAAWEALKIWAGIQ
ncbi:hypothetical protein [Paramicrobacterium chengjingii]|uniref:hypothetical protein n=1 Tax=Paramicrobacterium chengjingii TaxID=2769067 RepID=UPI0014204571|nr:hypothetical protein [Microbacterium chengjingii]